MFEKTPPPYKGPVPMVTHVHGAHTYDDSDGFTEAWYLPNAKNIPDGFARFGSKYANFRTKARDRNGQRWRSDEDTDRDGILDWSFVRGKEAELDDEDLATLPTLGSIECGKADPFWEKH